MKKLNKFLIISLATLTLCGCGKIPTLSNGDEAVVTSDSGNISANELYEKIKNTYGRDVLIEMIDTMILEAKYDENDDEKEYIDEQIAQVKQSAEQNGVTFDYLLSYYGMSEDDLTNNARLLYRRNLAVYEYLENELTDKEINNYYKDEVYGDINVKHIMIAPESLDGMTTSEKEKAEKEAEKKAKEIIKKLNNNEKWSDLVKEYSDDENTKDNDGNLGWFNTGEMQEDFEKKAFALKKGEYTKTPAKTSYGYHIILKVDEKEKPSLEKEKDTIKETVVKEKLNNDTTLYNKTLEKIRKDANLEIIDSELKKQYNNYMNELATTK